MNLWKRFVSNHRSNVYHCCLPKTGSQWIRKILRDPIVFRYSGLRAYHYQSRLPEGRDPRNISDRTFTEPFPPGTIITPLYISFDNFEALPKPEGYRAFFVLRDPRDILVSWYFHEMKHPNTRLGHKAKYKAESMETLRGMSFHDGILYAMQALNDRGHLQALASWIDAPTKDPNTLVVRFEDLIGSAGVECFETLFKHCDIHIPQNILSQLLAKYSFETLAGRKPGDERKGEHYRKGIAGDWKNYLSDALIQKFDELTGNLALRIEERFVGSRVLSPPYRTLSASTPLH